MRNFLISVKDKIAKYDGSEVIVCGNSDYTLTFSLDEEWLENDVKTARFIWKTDGGAYEYEDKVFSGDTVEVPILRNVDFVYIGLYAGNLITTTAARINCKRSATCSTGTQKEPSEDIYSQIMSMLGDMSAALDKINGEVV